MLCGLKVHLPVQFRSPSIVPQPEGSVKADSPRSRGAASGRPCAGWVTCGGQSVPAVWGGRGLGLPRSKENGMALRWEEPILRGLTAASSWEIGIYD